MNINKRARTALRGSVCAAAIVWANAAAAQSVPSYLGFGMDWDTSFETWSWNDLGVEGALGASNLKLEQTAVAQLNNAAGSISSDGSLFLDLVQDNGASLVTGQEISQVALNRAMAWTTQGDALLGGSQIGIASFNTGSFDITAGVLDGYVSVDQAITGLRDGVTNTGTDIDPILVDNADYGLNLIAYNSLDAAATYSGNAIIDGTVRNPDYIANLADRPVDYDPETPEFIDGVQQASVSLNTLRGTSAVDDNFIDFGGQLLDVPGFTGGDDLATEVNLFGLGAGNLAVAFSPRPTGTNGDPAIRNLDQIAAITANTISLGEVDGTANFTLSGVQDSIGGDSGQIAIFTGLADDLMLGNRMVATTWADDYVNNGGQVFAGPGSDPVPTYDGVGDVALDNVSQVAAVQINSIRQAGDGDLTLKQETAVLGDPATFVQSISDLNLLLGGTNGGPVFEELNAAVANTGTGNSSITDLSQVAQVGLNGISSGGDINGWTGFGIPEDDFPDIVQAYSSEVSGEGNSIGYEFVNFAAAWTDKGVISADGIDQALQITSNTVSAGGDLNANLTQFGGLAIDGLDDANQIRLGNVVGNVAGSDLSQLALLRQNSVSVEGNINAAYLDQIGSADVLSFDQGLNDLEVYTDTGNASIDGISQIAQVSFNSVSADGISLGDGEVGGLYQDVVGAPYTGSSVNDISVESDYAGNASLKDAEQVFVLNLNSISATGAVSGLVDQVATDVDLAGPYSLLNDVLVRANDDILLRRGVGGNASIDGLTQTLAANVNTFSAGSLAGADVMQTASNINIDLMNSAYVDAEWGAASATGIVQTAIGRVNYMSIATPTVD